MEIQKEFLIQFLKMAFTTITPWKKSHFENQFSVEYIKGWNDCLKEIKRNRTEYIKKFQNLKVAEQSEK